jgi:hypothetical protein
MAKYPIIEIMTKPKPTKRFSIRLCEKAFKGLSMPQTLQPDVTVTILFCPSAYKSENNISAGSSLPIGQ